MLNPNEMVHTRAPTAIHTGEHITTVLTLTGSNIIAENKIIFFSVALLCEDPTEKEQAYYNFILKYTNIRPIPAQYKRYQLKQRLTQGLSRYGLIAYFNVNVLYFSIMYRKRFKRVKASPNPGSIT